MSEYVSKIVRTQHTDTNVFNVLSNPTRLEPLIAAVPENEFIEAVEVDTDSIRLKTKQMGEVVMRIVDREDNKTIKFAAENSPIPVNLSLSLFL